jgi:hypothetical protein
MGIPFATSSGLSLFHYTQVLESTILPLIGNGGLLFFLLKHLVPWKWPLAFIHWHVNDMWNYAFILRYVLMVWCRSEHRCNFTFLFWLSEFAIGNIQTRFITFSWLFHLRINVVECGLVYFWWTTVGTVRWFGTLDTRMYHWGVGTVTDSEAPIRNTWSYSALG